MNKIPQWGKLLTDGITNKLVGCNLLGADERDTVLVRVYGNKTDLLIDRTAETRWAFQSTFIFKDNGNSCNFNCIYYKLIVDNCLFDYL